MSFTSISVKEAVENINAANNGWFLPAVQRPYVWGSRYESEKYICKLFDSILRGYPIGTLIVWNSDKEIPYRNFIEDYKDGDTAPFVDKHLWNREDKWLVYDGQQRLQTLYSCLKHTLNNRILVYNLFFNLNDNENTDVYGFSFIDKNSESEAGTICMNQLFVQPEDEKVKYRKEIQKSIPTSLIENSEDKFEEIIDKLWDVFVRKDVKSLAYFPIDKSWSEERVNDVFQRLNMGGVSLSGADLLLSRIKEVSYDYEEKLQTESKQIFNITQGYSFEPTAILQLVHLLIKGGTRIAPDRVSKPEIACFIQTFDMLKAPLDNFFNHFIWGQFKINNSSIIPRGAALFPLMVYVYNRHQKGTPFIKLEPDNLLKMKQYFIISQMNDWNTQTLVNKFAQLAKDTEKDFPLDEMSSFAGKNNRLQTLSASHFEEYTWFPLKVLTPNHSYVLASTVQGRYKPEIDHIFPQKLANAPADYDVNILWNMQPITGVINASKGNKHPKDFFQSVDGAKYINDYDFIIKDFSNPVWTDHKLFIEERKKEMVDFMLSTYGIQLI